MEIKYYWKSICSEPRYGTLFECICAVGLFEQLFSDQVQHIFEIWKEFNNEQDEEFGEILVYRSDFDRTKIIIYNVNYREEFFEYTSAGDFYISDDNVNEELVEISDHFFDDQTVVVRIGVVWGGDEFVSAEGLKNVDWIKEGF
jgi:hypothetical protein